MEAAPDPSLVLKDRADAGRRLAEKLVSIRGENPVVLAAHRGGTPVAFEVARGLGAPLDLLVVREVSSPAEHGTVLGAVAEGNVRAIDRAALEESGYSVADLEPEIERVLREVERAAVRYREGRPPLEVRGRTVVLVADGIAQSVSMRAAVGAARARGARRLVVAIGVCARPTTHEIRRECDETIVLRQPEFFLSVREWYRDFPSVTEDEVLSLLRTGQPHAATRGTGEMDTQNRERPPDASNG
jgi:putative phosphoribosyl transferase